MLIVTSPRAVPLPPRRRRTTAAGCAPPAAALCAASARTPARRRTGGHTWALRPLLSFLSLTIMGDGYVL